MGVAKSFIGFKEGDPAYAEGGSEVTELGAVEEEGGPPSDSEVGASVSVGDERLDIRAVSFGSLLSCNRSGNVNVLGMRVVVVCGSLARHLCIDDDEL